MVLNLGPLAPDATALTTRQSFLGSSCFSIKFNSESEPRKCQSKEGKDDVGRDKKCFLMQKNCGRLCFVSEAGQAGKKVFAEFPKVVFLQNDAQARWLSLLALLLPPTVLIQTYYHSRQSKQGYVFFLSEHALTDNF